MLFFGIVCIVVLGLFILFLKHPFATMLLVHLLTGAIIACVYVIRRKKKQEKKKSETEPETVNPDPKKAEKKSSVKLSPEEITKLLDEKVAMMFGKTATWKPQSDAERDDLFYKGQGFIVVTTDTGMTTILVDLIPVFKMTFSSFQPLEEIKVDYSLVAFEWVTAHWEELGALFSSAIGNGDTFTLLKPEFLPEKKAWNDLCHEIETNGSGFKAGVCDDGIRVTFPVE